MARDLVELLKMGIAAGAFPKQLFKYRAMNAYIQPIFENAELWFSSPTGFNDPFDFKINDTGTYTKADVVSYLTNRGIAKPQAEIMAGSALKNSTGLKELIETAKNNAFNKRGVLCLSKVPDNILMWSHYASDHKGFVLGFDLEEDLGFFVSILNIKYAKKYPSIAYLKYPEKIVDSCIRTKHVGWSYEEEVRIVKPKAGLYNFNKKALSKVIFGCRMSDKDKNFITDLLKIHSFIHTQCYQAKTSASQYKIEIDKI